MLTDLEQAALAKVGEATGDLPVGTHRIDMTVRIKGTVTKGKDYTQRVYQSVPFDKLLAIALNKLNGVTLESIVREALESEVDSSEVKARVKDAVQGLVDASEKTCNGKLTANLHVERSEVTTRSVVLNAAEQTV